MPGATSIVAGDGATTAPPHSRGELIAKVGTIVSAIMASSCCWLPVLLLAVGVSGAGIASALESYRPLFMVVTFAFLGMAFYFTYRPRHALAGQGNCCSVTLAADSAPPAAFGSAEAPTRPARRFGMMEFNKLMLWAVTALAVVFLFFPQVITRLIGPPEDVITADMTRLVVAIDGMTCEG